jgi:hypothetical protein
MYIVTIKRAYVNTAAVENQPVLNIANVSVVLVIQHANRKRHLSPVPYFSTLSSKEKSYWT